MKGNSIKEISLKHLLRKENIIFCLIITLLIVILFIALTVVNFIVEYKSDTDKYNVSSRTLIVDNENKTEEELNAISEIEHIITNVSELYYNPFWTNVSEFDEENFKGYMGLKPLLNNNDVKIVDGRNIENEYEIIIPTKFYPHSEFNDFGEDDIARDKMLDGKSIIGMEINLYSDKNRPSFANYWNDEDEYERLMEEWKKNRTSIKFKIVGTFDSSLTLTERNVGFASMKAIDNLKADDLISGGVHTVLPDGTENITPIKSNKRMIIVDNYKNLKYVKDELTNKGYLYSEVLSYDKLEMGILLFLPLSIAIAILIITIILIKNFLTKKFRNRGYELGVLKAIGFKNKEVEKIELYENLVVFLASLIVGLIFYVVLFILIRDLSSFFARAEYFSVIIRIPYLYIVMMSIFIIVYIYFTNKRLCSKFLKSSISELLKED